MTLEDHEDSGPLPGHQASAKTRVHPALVLCAGIAATIPLIILLLPVYALIQIYVAAAGIRRVLRAVRMPSICIPDACSASQKLTLR